jgi:hypothetical protein
MNLNYNHYQEQEFDYQVDDQRRGERAKPSRKSRMSYARSNRPAVSHNGIHRRRNKRFAW